MQRKGKNLAVAKIGIFGGTFNPPHVGHLHIVSEFVQACSLDEVLIIPTFIPPHKATPDLASGEDRLELCRRTFVGPPFVVSNIELNRHDVSYTVDTLKALKEVYGEETEFYFLVGDDMLFYLPKWKNPEELLSLTHFVSSVRSNDVTVEELEQFAKETYPKQYEAGRFSFLQMEPLKLSSTEVRDAVKAGTDISSMVTPAVAAYITEKGLYL